MGMLGKLHRAERENRCWHPSACRYEGTIVQFGEIVSADLRRSATSVVRPVALLLFGTGILGIGVAHDAT
jgi:hypothetical protein